MNPKLRSQNETSRTATQNVSVETVLENNTLTNPEQYTEYKNVLLNQNQAEKLVAQTITVEELARLAQEQLHGETQVEQNIDQAQQVSKQAEQEQVTARQEAEQTAAAALEKLKSGNTAGIVDTVKDTAKEAGASAYELQFNAAMTAAGTALSSFKIFEAIKIFFKGLFGAYVTSEVISEGVDTAKQAASEQIQKITQQEVEAINTISTPVYQWIEKFIWVPLSPEEKQILQKRLNPNEAGSYITVEQYRELMSKDGKLSLDDIKSLNLLTKIKQDPELVSLKEKILNHMQTKVFNQIRWYFSKIGVEFNAEKDSELKKIVSEEFSKTSAYKKGVEFQNTWKMQANGIEIVGSPFEIWGMIGIIFLRAFGVGIIDIKHLVFWIANEGVDTLTIWLKGISGEEVLPEINASMSWDSFDEHISQMDPEKKVLLLRAFQWKLWLTAAVLWTVSGKLLDGTLTLIEGSKRIAQGESFFTGPVERLQKTLEIIKPGKGKWLGDITKAVQQSKLSYEAVAALKLKDVEMLIKTREIIQEKALYLKEQSSKLIEQSDKIMKESSSLTGIERIEKENIAQNLKKEGESMLKESNVLKNKKIFSPSEAKTILSQTLSDSTKELTDLQSKVSLLSKNRSSLARTPLQSYFLRKNIDELTGIVKINQELWQWILNGNLWKYGSEIHKLVKSFNLRQIQGNIVMDIADITSAKELGKALWRLSPEILKTFFKWIPIFVLGGAMFEASQEEEASTFEKVKKALCLTNGFYGAGILLSESNFSIDKENGFHMENPWKFWAGIMLWGIEAGFFSYTVLKNYKSIWLGRAIWKGIFETTLRIPLEAAKMVSWPLLNGSRIAQIVSKFPTFLKSTWKSTVAKWSWKAKIAWLLVLGLWSAAAYAMGEPEIENLLSDKNNFNPDWSPKPEKVKEAWEKSSKNEKKELLDTLLISKIGTIFEPFKNDIQTTFDENGNYTIILSEENTNLVNLQQTLSDMVEYDLIQFMSDAGDSRNVIIKTGSI